MGMIERSLGGRTVAAAHFPELAPLLARINAAYKPIEIILYGSRARGDATKQSDWDLKVIVADDASEYLFSPRLGWQVQQGTGIHADVSCIRLSDFQSDLFVANSAASHIVDDGLILRVD